MGRRHRACERDRHSLASTLGAGSKTRGLSLGGRMSTTSPPISSLAAALPQPLLEESTGQTSYNRKMRTVSAPGLATARLYVWLVLLSPLLLLLFSIGLVVVGIWVRYEAVAGIGAAGIIGGLLLP